MKLELKNENVELILMTHPTQQIVQLSQKAHHAEWENLTKVQIK